ncbi:HAMP domain-containing sensor histidine kinase [Capillimicrobium parvum]|uniref:Signal transduction histidine-protein kinase/phosphatase MprB n=1 Tax=Capillimicrobium parvum TaxID=2884022 RepID=A0A9E7C171_9ACTN|nr:HAMP domain-containing sensor histidine kinase [Capillimicrobium parvum]UGS36133.1 Adaptive-response sensory-kinase SasA [Capillimicrobium parvum]
MLGLRGRLTAALLVVSALTLAVAAILLLAPLDRRLRTDALASLKQTVGAAAPGFRDIDRGDLRPGGDELERAARALRRRAGAEVDVVDGTGLVLTTPVLNPDERFPDVARAIREHRLIGSIDDTGGEQVAQVAVPFEVAGHDYALAVRKSLEDLGSAQEVVRHALLVAALIALGVALVVGVALAGRLAHRLKALRDTALRVAELGPVAEMRADDARDEVGDLTRAFATMQQRLLEQEQARRTFVATASHELRTPLASLRLMLDSASEELAVPRPDLDDARDQLSRAVSQTERLSKLARDLLDLSRLDAGVPPRTELVELVELSRSVLAEFEPRTADAGSPIDLVAPAPRWAVADPGSVAQIIRILVDNALRHSPPAAAVCVEVPADGDRPVVVVQDHGPGVSAEDAERIFERFERGTDAATVGFGLGLAIGRELARRMGGDLTVDPGAPGARFTLALTPAPAAID